MQILEQVLVYILSGFLAFSGFLAAHIEGAISTLTPDYRDTVVEVATSEVPVLEEPEVYAELPSRYERGGPIPRILIEHAGYQQQANILDAATNTETPDATVSVSDALVNVFCTYREDDTRVRATTGSGVFIDSRGIILTNAHVAQFLLLEAADVSRDAKCTIRTGSPATASYIAELLYISPAWVYENAALIDAERPSGTGERDYALLYVSEGIDEALPARFPAVALDTDPLGREDDGRTVLAAGYPAEVFRENGPRAELTPKVATTTITELYTFGGNHVDLMAIGSSAVGEQGSSGGPVLRLDGSLIGLIVTRGNDADGATSLRALTLSYINNTIEEETGFNLGETVRGELAYRASVFREALVPFLSSVLSDEL